MTLQDLGSIGEVVGALAVVVTLIYLAKQIKQNTHAMEEGRRLALAQTYQMRSDALQAMLVQAADSEHIGPIIIKLTEKGYPEDVAALQALNEAELRALGLTSGRRSFFAEIERLTREAAQG
jgi:hypothetical protein